MGTTAPLSGSPLPASAMRKAPTLKPAIGETCDGLPPPWRAASDAVLASGSQRSKWTFDLQRWRWERSGGGNDDTSVHRLGRAGDKHALAARRWGDGRDTLAAAVKRARVEDGGSMSAQPAEVRSYCCMYAWFPCNMWSGG